MYLYRSTVIYDALKMCTELLEISPLINANGLKFLNENNLSPNAVMSVGLTFYFCCVK